ncbi:MAG: hypothetical protein KGI54_18535, partial [Pseudomonadota bacterium]|nr:hypothetical protein [Pseudomonadota bacterium]
RYAANKSFLLSGGNTGKQWTQLQRIMTTAVADGADLASVNRAILATMQQGAAAGAIFNGTGVAGIYNRVLSSGAAGGKTGALETTITSAISSTLDNPGGSIMSAMPLYAYIKSHGGAHATAKSLLGKYYNSFTKTGQGQEIIAALNNAQGNPFVQIQMLGAAFKGHLSTALGIYSNYYSPEGPGRRELALGSSIGITPLVGTAIYGGGTGSPPASAASAVKAAAKATGVDPNVLTALFGGEDALGRGGVGNGGGLGQMTAGALKAVGMAGANMNDPATAAKASALYYKKMYALFKNVKNRKQRMEDAFLAYNMGPGYASQIENGTLPSTIMVNGREIHPYANLANKMKYFTGFSSSSSSTSANTSLAQAGNVNKVNAAAADTQAAKNIADTLGKAIQHYAGTLFHVQHAAMEVTNATISVAAADFRNLGSYSDMLNPSAFGISPHKPLKNP